MSNTWLGFAKELYNYNNNNTCNYTYYEALIYCVALTHANVQTV